MSDNKELTDIYKQSLSSWISKLCHYSTRATSN